MNTASARWIGDGRSIFSNEDERIYRAPVGVIEGRVVVSISRVSPSVVRDRHEPPRHEPFVSMILESESGDLLAVGINHHGGASRQPNNETIEDMTLVAEMKDGAAQVRFIYPNGEIEVVSLIHNM